MFSSRHVPFPAACFDDSNGSIFVRYVVRLSRDAVLTIHNHAIQGRTVAEGSADIHLYN